MTSDPANRTRVVIDIEDGRARAQVVLPKRKETKTMNYREFDPANTCLPTEAYPYLWAALATPSQPRPTLWDRITSAFRRVQAALPVLVAATFLPLADPPAHHLMPLRVVFDGYAPAPKSLVWDQPYKGYRPATLPIAEGNPYCF